MKRYIAMLALYSLALAFAQSGPSYTLADIDKIDISGGGLYSNNYSAIFDRDEATSITLSQKACVLKISLKKETRINGLVLIVGDKDKNPLHGGRVKITMPSNRIEYSYSISGAKATYGFKPMMVKDFSVEISNESQEYWYLYEASAVSSDMSKDTIFLYDGTIRSDASLSADKPFLSLDTAYGKFQFDADSLYQLSRRDSITATVVLRDNTSINGTLKSDQLVKYGGDVYRIGEIRQIVCGSGLGDQSGCFANLSDSQRIGLASMGDIVLDDDFVVYDNSLAPKKKFKLNGGKASLEMKEESGFLIWSIKSPAGGNAENVVINRRTQVGVNSYRNSLIIPVTDLLSVR